MPTRNVYDAMVRYAGTSETTAVQAVMGEVAANGVSLGDIRAGTGPIIAKSERAAEDAKYAAQQRGIRLLVNKNRAA